MLHLLCVPAASFPDRILAAHQNLHKIIPLEGKHQYYGIARTEDGDIKYIVAAHKKEKKLGVDKCVLPARVYIREVIRNYTDRPEVIGELFQKMLEIDGLDPQGYCLE